MISNMKDTHKCTHSDAQFKQNDAGLILKVIKFTTGTQRQQRKPTAQKKKENEDSMSEQ